MNKKNLIAVSLGIALVGALFYRLKPVTLAVGQAAPAFRMPGLGGEQVALADYRGKVVLVNFWATWCDTCKEEMPELERLYLKLRPRGFELLAPSVDAQGRKAVLPYVARTSPSFKVLLADPLAAQAYGVRGLPAAFLINSEGVLLRRYIGAVAFPELENDILKALERRPS